MKTKPFGHQAEEWERTSSIPAWCYFWDMGTGKTKMAVDMAGALYESKEIDGVLIVAPNSVHDQWVDEEIPLHLPGQYLERSHFLAFRSNKAATKWQARAAQELLAHDGLAWLAISYDGFMTDAGKKLVWKFLKKRRTFYVVDESHFIKSPNAERTKSIVASGKYAHWKRALSGTPVSESPFDAYAQVKFVDSEFWKREDGIADFLNFKHRFGQFRTIRPAGAFHDVEIVTGYQNLDRLNGLMTKISSTVRKSEVMDLPPKTYIQRHFDITAEQRRVYEELKDEFESALDGGEMVTTAHVLTRVTRFQQLLSGFLPADSGAVHEFKPNHRLKLLEEVLEGVSSQTIIWAVFNHDVDAIMALLGERAVRYDGKVDLDERRENRSAFKGGLKQFFVSKTSAGGTGQNLTNADVMIYYNTTRSLVQRLQSEDRFYRAGQTKPTTIIDITARGTLESGIVTALREKLDVEAQVTGKQVRGWL